MTGLDLVTGGAGFVGRALVAQLRARGRRVRVLDLKADGPDAIRGSVTDADAVARAVDGAEGVYHLAGIADLWRRSPADFDDINHQGTRYVLDAARRAGARRFLLCSSATTLVAGSTPIGDSTIDETVAHAPSALLGPYPASKRRAELYAQDAAAEGFNAVIVNPTEPIGAGDDAITPPTRMMLDFLNGANPAYVDCLLNFAPTVDLAEGMIAAMARGRSGERYILAGEDISLGNLLRLLTDLTGRPTPETKLPYAIALAVGGVETGLVAALTGKPPRAPLTGVRLAGRRVVFSSGKAANELGWRAGPLRLALQEMLEWAAAKGLLAPAKGP